MEADIWYGTSTELGTNGHGYLMLVLNIPSGEQNTCAALLELQNIEKIYPDISVSDYQILNVQHSDNYKDTSISIIVPLVSGKLANVIKTMRRLESRQWKN